MKKAIATISALLFGLVGSAAQAIDIKLGGLNQTATKAGYVKRTVADLTGSALNLILSAVGILFLVLMIYGGFMWMTAQGNMDQVGRARKLIIAGVIGLVIVVSAFAFVAYFGEILSAPTVSP